MSKWTKNIFVETNFLFLLFAAPVGRIAKYFYSSGLPIITSAGYTFDFEDKKTSCDHQFYMLTRAGLLSYKSMAFFMMAVMKE